jgi:hypothetical protein
LWHFCAATFLATSLNAQADFVGVAQDQKFHFTQKPLVFIVIPFSSAGKICHGGMKNKWHSGCYNRGKKGQRARIYITRDHSFVMDRIAWHECAHHAYGPKHTDESRATFTGEDPQEAEKRIAHKLCMLEWGSISRAL